MRVGWNEFILEIDHKDGTYRTVGDFAFAQTWDSQEEAAEDFSFLGLSDSSFSIQDLPGSEPKVTVQGYILALSENLTDDQKARIESVAFDAVFEGCQQDHSYMRGIVSSYLETLGPLGQVCEIAGGEVDLTVEILGFDPTTGEEVE